MRLRHIWRKQNKETLRLSNLKLSLILLQHLRILFPMKFSPQPRLISRFRLLFRIFIFRRIIPPFR
jgi:hypothetical protein